MSLHDSLLQLRDRLLGETTPATYRESIGPTEDVRIILSRQDLKAMDAEGVETASYERHVLLVPGDLGDYGVPHVGARLVYTDAAGVVITLEVNNNSDGRCYVPTKSGLWYRVFCKQLVDV